jgi:hypothetical protein
MGERDATLAVLRRFGWYAFATGIAVLLSIGAKFADAIEILHYKPPGWALADIGLALLIVTIGALMIRLQLSVGTPGPMDESEQEFYPSIVASRRSGIEEAFSGVGSVKFLLVGGNAIVANPAILRKIKSALLPNPNNESLRDYAVTVGDTGLIAKVKAATKVLLEHGIPVGWQPHFIGYTIAIADPASSAGWTQMELVLPYMSMEHRPCVRLRNDRHAALTGQINDIFDRMFAVAYPPTLDDCN